MRKFLAASLLTTVMAVSCLAGDVGMPGNPAPPPPPPEGQSSTSTVPTVDAFTGVLLLVFSFFR